MTTRDEAIAIERARAIRALESAVYTCRGVQPPLSVDDIQDVVDATNVEYDTHQASRNVQQAAVDAVLRDDYRLFQDAA